MRFNTKQNVYIEQWTPEFDVGELWYSKSELMRLKQEHVEPVKRVFRLVQKLPKVPEAQEQQQERKHQKQKQQHQDNPLLCLRQALLDVFHACRDIRVIIKKLHIYLRS